jgi:stage V sporulation protein R
MDPELKRLYELDEAIQEIAREFGLDFFPQEFDVIPVQKMLEIMAYHFPVNFSHWSFGRDYERERTLYEHGEGIPYEVVLNSNPCRAFLVNTNPFPVQVMVMAHVYAHNDFMKNNLHFQPTRRDILPSASEGAARFQRYEKRFGLQEVERLLDAGLSIELNINPDFFIREESEEEQKERLSACPAGAEVPGLFDDLIPRKKPQPPTDDYYNRKTPLEPERDILLYVIHHSPKPLREWEKDILSVLRGQSRYFMPLRRTKIMNEGWATYWHRKIMERLFQKGYLDEREHGFYNLYNARVLATHPRIINPYLVGWKFFEDIEDRWNKGRFGKEWEECEDPARREAWDLKMEKGREKIFEVRQSYTDRFLVEQFLTEDLVHDLNLYLYKGQPEQEEIRYVVTHRDWRQIKNLLVSQLSTFGIPLILVEDGDFKGRRELYLKHAFDGIELDPEYRERTMAHIHYLWDRPIYLETVVQNEKVVFHFNGTKHTFSGGEGRN